jgi:hypothetical protein
MRCNRETAKLLVLRLHRRLSRSTARKRYRDFAATPQLTPRSHHIFKQMLTKATHLQPKTCCAREQLSCDTYYFLRLQTPFKYPLSIFTHNSLENVGFQGCWHFIRTCPDSSSGGVTFVRRRSEGVDFSVFKMGA